MSQKSSHNSKRRPPGEGANDVQQDADWGFDSDVADPAVEKKLAVALVVCLLAGFGFVFYQKFRILQQGETQQVSTESDGADSPDSSDGQGASSTPAADQSVVLGPTADERMSAGDLDESSTESPFYDASDADDAAPVSEESWTLTQAEVPQPSPSPAAPGKLPLLPDAASPSEFDPFAQTESTHSPTPAAGASESPESSTLVWNEPPVPAAQSEPESLLAEPSTVSEANDLDDPFSFADDDSPSEAMPSESAVEEPQMLIIDESAEQSAAIVDSSSTADFDPLPAQAEPHSMDAAGADTPQPETTIAVEGALAEDSFDPFSTSEPPSPPAPAAASTQLDSSEDPFSFPAPADSAGVDQKPDAVEPQPAQVVEPPAWPFSDAASAAESLPPADDSVDEPPPDMTFAPATIELAPAQQGVASAPAGSPPPNPFSFDSTTSRPIVSSMLSAQPVIGEREITVTPSDSFWSISEREYGSSRYFNALAQYNKAQVARPEELRSGMRITIPPPEVLEDRFPELFRRDSSGGTVSPMSGTSEEAAAAGLFLDGLERPHYRVGEKDTLSSIAQQHLGRSSRWTEIYDLNRDQLKSPSTLTIGMELKLPPDASGVQVAPADGFSR